MSTRGRALAIAAGLSVAFGCARSASDSGSIARAPGTTFVEDEPKHVIASTEDFKAEFRAIFEEYQAAVSRGPLDASACAEFEGRFRSLASHSATRSADYSMFAEYNAAAVVEACGDIDRARRLYRESCDRGSSLSCNNLGVILWNAGERAEAMRLFERVTELEERNKQAQP